jgi:hypothetical protein
VSRLVREGSPWAVFTVDPGGTTGVARGLFNRGHATAAATLQEAVEGETIAAWVETGPAVDQAWMIAIDFAQWRGKLLRDRRVKSANVFLVIEDFQLRQRSVELSPVEVTAGILTLLQTPKWAPTRPQVTRLPVAIERQSPSDAKSYATNDRLRAWGLYPLGRGKGDHKRDALRHLALKVNRLMEAEPV